MSPVRRAHSSSARPATLTAPPLAKWGRSPALARDRMRYIWSCPPACSTSRAVQTCSPVESIVGMSSLVPVPAPRDGPPMTARSLGLREKGWPPEARPCTTAPPSAYAEAVTEKLPTRKASIVTLL